MDWEEEIYKFKVVEIKKLGMARGFNRTYRLRAYGEKGQELNYPFGNFSTPTEARNRAKKLIGQI